MKRYWIAYCLIITSLLSCTSKNEVTYSTDPVENINALWQIIDTKYCYLDAKHIDWDSIHWEYMSRAALLKKDDEIGLFDLCAEMLDNLKDGHVNLYTPFDVSYNTAGVGYL